VRLAACSCDVRRATSMPAEGAVGERRKAEGD
jgi:hypothetical protein